MLTHMSNLNRFVADARTQSSAAQICVVCRAPSTEHFLRVDENDYWRCRICEARFLDPRLQPAPSEELSHYRHHENDPADLGYRKFLSKLSDALLEKLSPGMHGLDYGCGPGPALAAMLREAGQHMEIYDPFFYPGHSVLAQTYDFITCSEVAEHFHDPAREFDRLDKILRPGGWLGVMTCFQTDDARFANWHYRKDPTHVVFYREDSFRLIAAQRGWTFECPRKDVVLMQKRLAGDTGA